MVGVEEERSGLMMLAYVIVVLSVYTAIWFLHHNHTYDTQRRVSNGGPLQMSAVTKNEGHCK